MRSRRQSSRSSRTPDNRSSPKSRIFAQRQVSGGVANFGIFSRSSTTARHLALMTDPCNPCLELFALTATE